MKADTIVLIGGLAVGAYLLYKFLPSVQAFDTAMTDVSKTTTQVVYYATEPGWKILQNAVGPDAWTFLNTPGYMTIGKALGLIR